MSAPLPPLFRNGVNAVGFSDWLRNARGVTAAVLLDDGKMILTSEQTQSNISRLAVYDAASGEQSLPSLVFSEQIRAPSLLAVTEDPDEVLLVTDEGRGPCLQRIRLSTASRVSVPTPLYQRVSLGHLLSLSAERLHPLQLHLVERCPHKILIHGGNPYGGGRQQLLMLTPSISRLAGPVISSGRFLPGQASDKEDWRETVSLPIGNPYSGEKLVTASACGYIRVWTRQLGLAQVLSLPAPGDATSSYKHREVTALAYSDQSGSNGVLATGTGGGAIHLLDFDGASLVLPARSLTAPKEASVTALCFVSPHTLWAGYETGEVVIWDLHSLSAQPVSSRFESSVLQLLPVPGTGKVLCRLASGKLQSVQARIKSRSGQ